jgi:SSS family solute:Na+ symporter
VQRLGLVAAGDGGVQGHAYQAGAYVDIWRNMGSAAHNPMGVEWFGMAMGLGFVLSFGYWCTDFLVVQRAMAAEDEMAARRVPLIAAFPKMLFPFLVILPGMIAIALTRKAGLTGFALPPKGASFDYDMTIPLMLGHYFPNGLLGLGLTALLASFMSGMAGNVTAFNTVWTYDLYQSYLAPGRSDAHYLRVARLATVGGTLLSIAAAYMAVHFNNIMDLLQLVFAFVNAPLFATFLLGMFWKRTTGHGAFYGLLAGTLAAAAHHGLTAPVGAENLFKGGWAGHVLHLYPSEMAQNFWTAIWSWGTCFTLTLLLSLVTRRTRSDQELGGLVYSLTPRPQVGKWPWYQRPAYLGAFILAAALVLNLIFA